MTYEPYGNQYGASTGTHIAIQNDKIVYNKIRCFVQVENNYLVRKYSDQIEKH